MKRPEGGISEGTWLLLSEDVRLESGKWIWQPVSCITEKEKNSSIYILPIKIHISLKEGNLHFGFPCNKNKLEVKNQK